MLQCCISGSCPCYYYADLLANVSTNASICITTDMVLSSIVELAYLKNISIIGYNNPTVRCCYKGELHFVSCHNVTIKGITWNECGINSNFSTTSGTTLYIHNSSNMIFQHCTFQNSLGQTIVF